MDVLPDSIKDTPETIVDEILSCSECHRNYKIIPSELLFYRRMNIPIPRRCFYCRHHARIMRRNPLKLWQRSCMCELQTHDHINRCSNVFQTSYSPDRPEIVYCESCYVNEVQ